MEAALQRVTAAVARSRGSFVSPALEARAIAGMGVGVVARAPIPKDALVFRAAPEAWRPFSAERALETARQQAPRFLQQVDELVASNRALQAADSFVPNALVLGVHLLVNFAHSEDPTNVMAAVGADKSGRVPGLDELYVNALPRFVDLPFYWDDRQFKELEGCADVARSIQQSSQFYMQVYQHLFGAGNAFVNPEAFFWAVSILMSRATSGKQQPFTLIPFFDWFNHSDNGDECEHGYEQETGAFTVYTTREYAAGEQLCINYGHHSNVRLLRNYGFALPSNPHDVVELALPPNLQFVRRSDPGFAQKLALLESLRLPGVALRAEPGSSEPVPFRRTAKVLLDGQLAWESRRWLEILASTPEEIQLLVQQVATTSDGSDVAFPSSVKRKVGRQVLSLVGDRLEKHKTPLENDERFLKANEAQMAPWLRSCLYVRTGEKRILLAAREIHATMAISEA